MRNFCFPSPCPTTELVDDLELPGVKNLITYFPPHNGVRIQKVWKAYEGQRTDQDFVEFVVTLEETKFIIKKFNDESFIHMVAKHVKFGIVFMTEFKKTADILTRKVTKVNVTEKGAAKRMYDEWERLATACGFSTFEFTNASIQSFDDSFGAFHLLYTLANPGQRLITDYLVADKNKPPGKMGRTFPLEKRVTTRHPQFGRSFHARNRRIAIYYPQKGTEIRQETQEWYCEGDTDIESTITIGCAEFHMCPDGDESNVSMDVFGEQVGMLNTSFKKASSGVSKAIGSRVEEGSAKKMNRQWEKLAASCGLTRDEFTKATITTFGEYWFGGFRFLTSSARGV